VHFPGYEFIRRKDWHDFFNARINLKGRNLKDILWADYTDYGPFSARGYMWRQAEFSDFVKQTAVFALLLRLYAKPLSWGIPLQLLF